jgi:hypothetical protein
MDLHMEHLNRVCKDALCGLGANKTPKAIWKCIRVLKSVADNFDEQTGVNENKGYHTVVTAGKDRDSIISPLSGRCHSSFKKIDRSIFSKISWMKEHIPRCTLCFITTLNQHKYTLFYIRHNTYIGTQALVTTMIQNLWKVFLHHCPDILAWPCPVGVEVSFSVTLLWKACHLVLSCL